MVKNIADFGAFVDLGGIDGLLHITDMSWGRIGHPSEMVKIDQEVEVVILNVDRDKEKIALGLKQTHAQPVGRHRAAVTRSIPACSGKVVNIMSYGAFVKLEEGIEGLVHISEMSWTRRINHPSEMLNVGDEIEVVVLEDRTRTSRKSPWASSRPRSTPGRWSRRSTRPARSSPARSATSPTTARSWRSRKASTACCTSATCPGPRRSAIPPRCSRRARKCSAWS